MVVTVNPSYLLFLLIVSLLAGGTLCTINDLSKASNEFALDLYQALRYSSKNFLVSPISLHIVLGMVLQGANDTSADEIKKALHISEDNQNVLEGYKTFLAGLDDPVLKVANGMFIEDTFYILPEFNETLSKYFSTEVQKVSFKGQTLKASADIINQWVLNKTEHKIKDLISEGTLDEYTELLLVNAIHFKAQWKIKFNKRNTKEMAFFYKPGHSVDVKMMSLTGSQFRFSSNAVLGATILEIPYAENDYKMVIILPNEQGKLADVESKLKSIDFKETLSTLTEQTVNIYLPKFKIRKSLEMDGYLEKMGIVAAFDDGAGLSRMSNASVAIGKVVHKTMLTVNEKGSEAAAASGVVVTYRTYPIEIICDQPFIFMIMKGDVILFLGRLTKPF